MLAKRPPKHITDAVKRFGGITFKVEEKLDGERIQLHKRGSQYYYCSRKGKDYTYLYGKQPGIGSLTPYIHASFNPDVQELVPCCPFIFIFLSLFKMHTGWRNVGMGPH